MILLIPLIVLLSFIPNIPDTDFLLSNYAIPADTTIVVEGYIFNIEKGIPLANVTVQVNNSHIEAKTDRYGYYQMKGLPPGRYTMKLKEYPYYRAKYYFSEKEFVVSTYGINGTLPIPAKIDWMIKGDNRQYSIEYGDELVVSPDPRFAHLYVYDASSKEPISKNELSVLNGKHSINHKSPDGLYLVRTNSQRALISIGKTKYQHRWMYVNTTLDSIPSQENVIYIPLINKEEKKKFPVWAIAGQVVPANDYPLPSDLKISINNGEIEQPLYPDGSFFITGIRSGRHLVEISNPKIDNIFKILRAGEFKPFHRHKVDKRLSAFSFLAPVNKFYNRAIYGKIIDKETGEPIKGAKIHFGNYFNKYSAFSDQSGYYFIRGAVGGDYSITVEKEDYITYMRGNYNIEVGIDELNSTLIDISLNPIGYFNNDGYGSVKFKVYNSIIDFPVSDSEITHVNSNMTKKTDSNGYAIFPHLPVGQHKFTFQKSYHFLGRDNHREEREVIVHIPYTTGDVEDTIIVELQNQLARFLGNDGKFIYGTVRSFEGPPKETVTLTFLPGHQKTETDSLGNYHKYLTNGFYEVQVLSDRNLMVEDTLTVWDTQKTHHIGIQRNYTLSKIPKQKRKKNSISGLVLGAYDYQPQPGANVFLLNTDFHETVDQNGFFSFRNVPPGRYEMEISDLGCEVYTRWMDVGYSKEIQDTARYYLNPIKFTTYDLRYKYDINNSDRDKTSRFSGTLKYSPSEVPVAGTPVYLYQLDSATPDTFYSVTSYNGKFVFDVPEGNYQVCSSTPMSHPLSLQLLLNKNEVNSNLSLTEDYKKSENYFITPSKILSEAKELHLDVENNYRAIIDSALQSEKELFYFSFRDVTTNKVIPHVTVYFHNNLQKISNGRFFRSDSLGNLKVNLSASYQYNLGIYADGYYDQCIDMNYSKTTNRFNVYTQALETTPGYYLQGFPNTFQIKNEHYPRGIGLRMITNDLEIRPTKRVQPVSFYFHGVPLKFGKELLHNKRQENKYFIKGRYYITIYKESYKPETKAVFLHLEAQRIIYNAEEL